MGFITRQELGWVEAERRLGEWRVANRRGVDRRQIGSAPDRSEQWRSAPRGAARNRSAPGSLAPLAGA